MLTDRSRIEAYQRCPRSRWWGYHALGTGLRRNVVEWDLVVGSAVHHGVEVLLSPLLRGEVPNLEKSVESALSYFDALIMGYKVEEEEGADLTFYETYKTGEQRALVEGLVRVFALSESGLKGLTSRYEVLEVEHDEEPREIANQVRLQGKCDGLLKERVTGDLFVLSLKTTGGWDARKENIGRTDMQGKSETFLVEGRLKDWEEGMGDYKGVPQWFINLLTERGGRIEGVQYMYLVKGNKKKDRDGVTKVASTLIRPYKQTGVFDSEYRWQWEGLHWSKWKACNIWEEGIGVRGWIERLSHEYLDEWKSASVLENWIIVPEPYRRGELEVDDWVEQAAWQEQQVLAFSECIEKDLQEDVLQRELNRGFPQFTHSCTYPVKCRFYELCYGPKFVRDEPLLNGFVRRVPHHKAEFEEFKAKGKENMTIEKEEKWLQQS